jgi:hypothetical protein
MSSHDKFPVNERVDEREWQAQERALRELRAGMPSRDEVLGGDEALVARYRHVARALAVPPAPGLHAGFAAEVARLAATRHAAPDTGFERGLLRALLLAMVLSSAVVVAVYGVQWWRASAQLLGTDTLGWTIAVAACAALSWSLEWMRRRGVGDRADPASA